MSVGRSSGLPLWMTAPAQAGAIRRGDQVRGVDGSTAGPSDTATGNDVVIGIAAEPAG